MRTAPLQDRRITKSIAVRTDAKGLPILNLRFSVEVRAPIVFKPDNRLVISTIEGQETRKRVLLRRADGEALEILSAETGDQTLRVATEPVVKKERTNEYEAGPGDVWLELVLPADSPIGHREPESCGFPPTIPLRSRSTSRSWLRVRPLIEHRPDGVRLVANTESDRGRILGLCDPEQEMGRGSFHDHRNRRLTSRGLSLPRWCHWRLRNVRRFGWSWLRGLGPEAISSTIEGWIEITTDDPIRSKLNVPVIVASSREKTRRPFQTRRTVGE